MKGLGNIPKEGPILIVSNHPSGYFDPLCICSVVSPKISFLGKSTIFSNKLLTLIFTNLNIVPVYRTQDDPNNKGKNDEMFQACYDKLANKGIILIFPEGTSKSDRRLGSLKTGAARIALGAASINNFKVKPKLLPVGLNYTNSSKFRSVLSIEFGSPISSEDYFKGYQNEENQCVKVLTADVEESIKNLIINIEKVENEELVRKVEKIINAKDFKHKVSGTQDIYEAIIYYQKYNNALYELIKKKIDDYFNKLEDMNINDRSLQSIGDVGNIWRYMFKTLAYAILGFPFWFFGVIHAYPPYKITRLIVPKITDRREFYGVMGLMIGIGCFISVYSIYLVVSWIILKSLIITFTYLLVLPITAVFCLHYARVVRKLYFNVKISSKIFSSQKVLAKLISDRNDILTQIEKIKSEYLNISSKTRNVKA